MGATRSNKEGVYHFDVARSPFECHFGVLMWPHDSWKKGKNNS